MRPPIDWWRCQLGQRRFAAFLCRRLVVGRSNDFFRGDRQFEGLPDGLFHHRGFVLIGDFITRNVSRKKSGGRSVDGGRNGHLTAVILDSGNVGRFAMRHRVLLDRR